MMAERQGAKRALRMMGEPREEEFVYGRMTFRKMQE